MWLLVLAAVVVVGALAAGAAVLATRSKADYDRSNRILADQPTNAPSSWAGSHDPEALLHRRLRDSMRALAANQAFDDDGGLLDARVELEQQALAIDNHLVAVAALPAGQRSAPLAEVTTAVETIETAVAELANLSAGGTRPALDAVVERVRQRTTVVDQIRAELDTPGQAAQSGEAGPPATERPAAEPPATGSTGTAGGASS